MPSGLILPAVSWVRALLRKLEPSEPPPLRKVVIWVLAAFLGYAVEHSIDLLGKIGDEPYHPPTQVSLMLYRFITSGGPRLGRFHHSVIVLFSQQENNGRTPTPALLFSNDCLRKKFYGRLIALAGSQSASAVVLDNAFSSPTTCIEPVKEAVQSLPANVGFFPVCDDDAAWDKPLSVPAQEYKALVKSGAVILQEQIQTFSRGGKTADCGLSMLNADVRKIPLFFPAYFKIPGSKALRGGDRKDGLAWSVARYRDPALLQALQSEYIMAGVHPYASFVKTDKTPFLEPTQLICGRAPGFAKREQWTEQQWNDCLAGTDEDSELVARLQHNIVFIGEESDNDRHASPLGRVPGVQLHANYTESLLDDNWYKPVHWLWEISLSVLLAGLLELVFQRTSFGEAMVVSVVIVLAVVLVMSEIVAGRFHIYCNLMLPSAAFLLLKFARLEDWLEQLADTARPRRAL